MSTGDSVAPPEYATYLPGRQSGAWRMHESIGRVRQVLSQAPPWSWRHQGHAPRVWRMVDGQWREMSAAEVRSG